MVIMKNGKRQITEEIELLNKETKRFERKQIVSFRIHWKRTPSNKRI